MAPAPTGTVSRTVRARTSGGRGTAALCMGKPSRIVKPPKVVGDARDMLEVSAPPGGR
jgi:hypothetical protein